MNPVEDYNIVTRSGIENYFKNEIKDGFVEVFPFGEIHLSRIQNIFIGVSYQLERKIEKGNSGKGLDSWVHYKKKVWLYIERSWFLNHHGKTLQQIWDAKKELKKLFDNDFSSADEFYRKNFSKLLSLETYLEVKNDFCEKLLMAILSNDFTKADSYYRENFSEIISDEKYRELKQKPATEYLKECLKEDILGADAKYEKYCKDVILLEEFAELKREYAAKYLKQFLIFI